MTTNARRAVLYRMVMSAPVRPFGLKSRWQLRHHGYQVEDHPLRTREEVDRFKAAHGVTTTPQTFIAGERIGGHDDLRRFFGGHAPATDAVSYRPVIAVFATTALAALALGRRAFGTPWTGTALGWFVSLSMVVLAIGKLQDVERFSSSFLHYDLLARRWVPYAYLYPFGEALAGVLMTAGVLTWLSAPIALFIGAVSAVSVVKAVYVDRRALRCACVGGAANVPLGFVSLTEKLFMIGRAIAMVVR